MTEFRIIPSLFVFISILLLVSVTGTIFGGLDLFHRYQKSANPSAAFNMATFHFFTREYIQRKLQKLDAARYSPSTSILELRVFADEEDINDLNSDLPASGKLRFVSGHMKVGDAEFSSEIDFRFRGGLPMHWLYDKKSLRIKLPPYTTYRGERQFNVVNPSTIHTITDLVSYDIARTQNILTPDYFPVRLYFNNNSNGLHFFLSRIDESFLRKNRRMPGSIYSGDTWFPVDPLGTYKQGTGELVAKDSDGDVLLWSDERLWKKSASRNAEKVDDQRDIKTFLMAINQADPQSFQKLFESYFDKKLYYKYWAIDTLLGSYHHDNFHNHKMYFDPYKGKFEPIEWDIRFWSSNIKAKDTLTYPLLKQVKLNPIFEYERDLETYKLLKEFTAERVNGLIDSSHNLVSEDLRADPYRQAPEYRYARFTPDKTLPFSMEKYEKSIDELKLTFKNRREFVKAVLNNSIANYSIENISDNQFKLIISVSGNSPIEVKLHEIAILRSNGGPSTETVIRRAGSSSPVGRSPERLFPGRKPVLGNTLGRNDEWALSAFGKSVEVPVPLYYEYIVSGVNISKSDFGKELEAKNAITGNPVSVKFIEEMPVEPYDASRHPWNLSAKNTKQQQTTLWKDKVIIDNDRVFESNETVTIMPGTTIKLSKDSSVIFFGKVTANGTAEKPIIFERLNAEEPWGSIVIQGEFASNSELSFIDISGGSVDSYGLIDYPGQINVHDLRDFAIRNCVIRDNVIGDDGLHVAYSSGEITNCRFENAAFDALDMDIVDVSIKHTSFTNSGNDAMDFMTSKVKIENVKVINAGDKCISIGEASYVSLRGAFLSKCSIGIAVKDQSSAEVNDVEFDITGSEAISLYRKNSRYNRGGTIKGNDLRGITMENIQYDSASESLLNASSFSPEKITPKK